MALGCFYHFCFYIMFCVHCLMHYTCFMDCLNCIKDFVERGYRENILPLPVSIYVFWLVSGTFDVLFECSSQFQRALLT